MRINLKDKTEKVFFNSVLKGSVFMTLQNVHHNGKVLMKIDATEDNRGRIFNAVNLIDGNTLFVYDDDEVTILNVELNEI